LGRAKATRVVIGAGRTYGAIVLLMIVPINVILILASSVIWRRIGASWARCVILPACTYVTACWARSLGNFATRIAYTLIRGFG